jgi:hypothetical protein
VVAERGDDGEGRHRLDVSDVLLALRLGGSSSAQGHPERRRGGSGVEGWQGKTADGGVLADNGTWHHFTVGTRVGRAVGRRMEIVGGLALIAIGAKILVEHLW